MYLKKVYSYKPVCIKSLYFHSIVSTFRYYSGTKSSIVCENIYNFKVNSIFILHLNWVFSSWFASWFEILPKELQPNLFFLFLFFQCLVWRFRVCYCIPSTITGSLFWSGKHVWVCVFIHRWTYSTIAMYVHLIHIFYIQCRRKRNL